MTLDDLTKILPIPEFPMDNLGNWLETEKSLGVTLPSDYKEFIGLYGSV